MTNKFTEKKWQSFIEPAKSFLIIIAALYALYLLIKFLLPAITPFIIGAFITYIVRPMYFFLRKQRIPRGLSVLLTYLIFFALFGLFLGFFIPILISQTKEFIQYLPRIEKTIIDFTEKFKHLLESYSLGAQFNLAIQRALSNITSEATNLIRSISVAGASIVIGVLNFILSVLISIYLLKDWTIISSTIKNLLRSLFGEEAVQFLSESNKNIALFVRGQILVGILTGILTGVSLFLLGVPLAEFIGVLVAIFDLVPYFGPIIAGGLAVLLALSISPSLAFWTLIVVIAIQQVESLFLSPLIVGKNTQIHPLAVLFSFLLGGMLFGFVGIIIAVPAAGIVKTWIERRIM